MNFIDKNEDGQNHLKIYNKKLRLYYSKQNSM